MKKIEVVAAIVIINDKILCVQRNVNKYEYISLKYEFPGGKIENGESQTEAVIREIREELCLDIQVDKKFLTVSHKYPDFHLIMHSFLCSAKSEELKLTEHISFQWLKKDNLSHLDWAEADVPIVKELEKM